MTKKFICPSCKYELEYVEEVTISTVEDSWKICEQTKEPCTDQDLHNAEIHKYFRCSWCRYPYATLEEFIAEEET